MSEKEGCWDALCAALDAKAAAEYWYAAPERLEHLARMYEKSASFNGRSSKRQLRKRLSCRPDALLVARTALDVTTPDELALVLNEEIERVTRRMRNGVVTKAIRKYSWLGEADRDDLNQEALVRLLRKRDEFTGQRESDNCEHVERWRWQDGTWQKGIEVLTKATFGSFAYGVFANTTREYARATRKRSDHVPLRGIDATSPPESDGAFGEVVTTLRGVKDIELLFYQAAGYSASEVSPVNLRMRLSRARKCAWSRLLEKGLID